MSLRCQSEFRSNTTGPQTSNKKLFVVGIGASAGGLSALKTLFANLPTDSGAAFVVIQHLSPNFKSLMKELLERHTEMAVYRVTQGMKLEPNSVFLIPPGKNLIVEANVLKLQERKKNKHEINFPIDLFLTSLAKNYQEKAIGVILSGSGSDGTHGLKAINEAGGIALVQDPETAEFNGMPLSAVATGIVNQILPVPELAKLIYRCIISPFHFADVESTENALLSDSNLRKIVTMLLDSENIDFSDYKTTTISRRIHRRRLLNNLGNITSYIKLLSESPEEKRVLCSDLLINVTQFFRDQPAWKSIAQNVLPAIVERAEPQEELRFWVAGCSTGQEAYSLAILVHEALQNADKLLTVKIFATDIDRNSLEIASAGIYPQSIARNISTESLQKYFVLNDDYYQVTRKIREMLIFSAHDLTKNAVFTRLHFVSCRNVLIYMQSNLQQQILRNFHFSLRTQGMLLLGEAESVGQFESEFKNIDKKWKIYQKQQNLKLPISNPNLFKPAPNYLTRCYKPPVSLKTQSIPALSLRRLLNRCNSVILIVDPNNRLLHVYGECSHILKPHQGEIVTEVTRMVKEAFQLPLNTALYRAKKEKKTIDYTNIKFKQSKQNYQASLTVIPPEPNEDNNFYLIKIEAQTVKASQAKSNAEFEVSTEAQRRIFILNNELQHTRENLQALVEELETTNEEQQASNEELTASNEELQSTNEELHTVNIEYQSKIGELTQLNDDIDNLLKSTDIGVIFLDSEFKIRKFTPAVTIAIALRQSDLERPLEDLSWKFECPNLLALLQQVLLSKQPQELEVKLKGTESYLLMQIHLYQTETGDSEGLVLNFIKIDEIKRFQRKLEREIIARQRSEKQLKINQKALLITQQRIENIFSSLEDAVWSFDLPEKKLGYINSSFEKIYGRTKKEFYGNLNLWLDVIHPQDREMVQQAHQKTRQSEKIDLEYRILHPDGSIRWVRDRSKTIYDDCGTAIRQDFLLSDLTSQKQAQQALKARELSFQAIFNSMFQFIGVLTPAGILLEANHTALAFGGLTLEDVLNRPFWEAKWWTISEATQTQLKKAIARAAQGEFVRYEVDVLGEKDRVATIDFSLKPVMDETGKVVQLIPEGREISELKQVREALRQTNLELERRVSQRTQSLAQFSDRLQRIHRLAISDYQQIEDLFTDYLQAGCQMFDLSTGIVSKIDNCIYKIVAVESPLNLKVDYEVNYQDTYCAEVVDTLSTITFNRVGKIESMKNHPVYLNLELESFIGTPIFVNGNLYGTLNFSNTRSRDFGFTQEEIKIVELMARDIGGSIASVQTKKALEQSVIRFRNTFEQAAVGVAHVSIEGKFIKVNQRLCDILGYENHVLLQTTFQSITHPQDLNADLRFVKQLLAGEISNYSLEKRYINQEKKIIWANLTVSLVKNDLGQPDYFISVIEDISERKKTEIDLEQSRIKLKQANQAKDKFIAHMSHELRTPLNSILGFSHILKQDSQLIPEQLKSINIINQSGQHLLTLINDILCLSKSTANKLELQYRNFSLINFLQDISAIFQIRVQHKCLNFVTRISSQLPAVVSADETRLRQVLLNLLSNAVKFTSDGTVTLSVSCLTATSKSDIKTIRFQVADTGVGIPQDKFDTVFAPFGQIKSNSSNSEGTGLGLPICQNILQLMNSKLHLTSQPGQGSRFWFDLNIEEVSGQCFSPDSPTSNIRVFRNLATACKVLVVDDNQDNRILLIDYLQARGFTLEEARDGREGIAIAEKFRPDAILMDLMMPVMNGKEAIKHIRQHSQLKNTVVLMISANAHSILDSSDIKCDDFLAKPVDLERLLALLEQHLPLEWQTEQTQSQLEVLPKIIDWVVPPQETLSELYQLVNLGQMQKLIQQINLLAEADSQYIYFSQKIRQLADNCQQDKLEELIESLIE